MKKYFNKRNIYIGLFSILYILCSICSLIHSFAFFGLANNLPMSIMLGTCFEIGQFAVLMSLLTSKKNDGKIMQYVLLVTLTIIQVLGNVFSSYKYLMINSVSDLDYFKKPIFIFTELPDDITTVIVTWIIGAILPIVCLLLTSMVSNYIMDEDPEDNKNLIEDNDKESNIEDKIDRVEKPSNELDKADKTEQSTTENNNIGSEINPLKEDSHEQEETVEQSEEIEETKQDPDNKEDDENGEGDDRSNTEVQINTERADKDNTEEVKEKTKSHFLNLN